MKFLLLIFISLLSASCHHNPNTNDRISSVNTPNESAEIIVDIDPFYNWGKQTKVRLQGAQAIEVRNILEQSPKTKMPEMPKYITPSPAPGMSVIEDGEEYYHIMPNCEVIGRRLSIDSKLKIYSVLSHHTANFTKPRE